VIGSTVDCAQAIVQIDHFIELGKEGVLQCPRDRAVLERSTSHTHWGM